MKKKVFSEGYRIRINHEAGCQIVLFENRL
jgi:hypothetical protein